jgi:hypothetical protein
MEKEFSVLPSGMSQDLAKGKIRVRRGVVLIVAAFLLLGAYITYEYRAAIFNPSVVIATPKENAKLAGPTIEVSGRTEPDSTVLIENEVVSIDEKGHFLKQIILFPGKATIKVVVTNRFGRQTTVMRHIDVKAGY